MTKDNKKIKLNIKNAIMIKELKNKEDLLELIRDAKEEELEVVEFTREMIETTSDKKVIEKTFNIKWERYRLFRSFGFWEKICSGRINR